MAGSRPLGTVTTVGVVRAGGAQVRSFELSGPEGTGVATLGGSGPPVGGFGPAVTGPGDPAGAELLGGFDAPIFSAAGFVSAGGEPVLSSKFAPRMRRPSDVNIRCASINPLGVAAADPVRVGTSTGSQMYRRVARVGLTWVLVPPRGSSPSGPRSAALGSGG